MADGDETAIDGPDGPPILTMTPEVFGASYRPDKISQAEALLAFLSQLPAGYLWTKPRFETDARQTSPVAYITIEGAPLGLGVLA